jgi:transcriptional regulator with XRE-family HTH domain
MTVTEQTPRRGMGLEIDGEKLRRLRKRKVWLIADLADRSGVHRNLISEYEHGKSGAHPDTIRKLADALEIEPAELIKE